MGEGCVSWVTTPSVPRKRSSGVSYFGVLLYSCLHPIMQNVQIRHGNSHRDGRSVLSGAQPGHCSCTNASRGSSAIAEILVNNNYCLLLCLSSFRIISTLSDGKCWTDSQIQQ